MLVLCSVQLQRAVIRHVPGYLERCLPAARAVRPLYKEIKTHYDEQTKIVDGLRQEGKAIADFKFKPYPTTNLKALQGLYGRFMQMVADTLINDQRLQL